MNFDRAAVLVGCRGKGLVDLIEAKAMSDKCGERLDILAQQFESELKITVRAAPAVTVRANHRHLFG